MVFLLRSTSNVVITKFGFSSTKEVRQEEKYLMSHVLINDLMRIINMHDTYDSYLFCRFVVFFGYLLPPIIVHIQECKSKSFMSAPYTIELTNSLINSLKSHTLSSTFLTRISWLFGSNRFFNAYTFPSLEHKLQKYDEVTDMDINIPKFMKYIRQDITFLISHVFSVSDIKEHETKKFRLTYSNSSFERV